MSDVEVEFLTGYTYAAHQIQWLNENGFTFEVNGAGKPRLVWAHVTRKMGGGDSAPKNTTATTPDWTKLNGNLTRQNRSA